MAAKKEYLFFLNLGFLGFTIFLSVFETSKARVNFLNKPDKPERYNFSVGNLVDSSESPSLKKIKIDNIYLTLKIFADKQYDFDQTIYRAEGNVKTIINGGTLRSDNLSYDKSTGILSAVGNIRFTKGRQYFTGKEFEFNLSTQEGLIKDVYGILDIKNVIDDLKIDSNSKKIALKDQYIDGLNNKENSYQDGIEFAFGNIKLPKNKITRSHKSIGSINDWRFKSDLIAISEKSWKSNRITFTNDPFDPHQISFEGIDVIAEEDKGELLITSSKTNLILENRTKFFLGKRTFGGKKKKKNKFELMIDTQDRDGLVLMRRSNTTNINNNIKIDFQPQFMISRALSGKTNSYINSQNSDHENINFSDLFGLNIRLNLDYKDWYLNSDNDLSTLNSNRVFSGLRHSSSLRKYFKLPILDYSNFNIFTTYRSRAWNGTIGETEIKSAYGGFLEKTHSLQIGEVKNNLNIRFGIAKYEAEKLKNTEIISLTRSSIFSSLDSEYEIWKGSVKNNHKKKDFLFSPVLIKPELVLRSNINSAYFKYEDGTDQGFIKFSLGPEIRLGELERKFLDYTKFSIMPGVKIKSGNSPFKFDNAVDLKTLNLSFMQQVYGPMIFDINSNLNIDKNSINFGEYYDTKLGLLWHKRAYEFGIYYHPDNDAGGLFFRINGFKFNDSVKEIF